MSKDHLILLLRSVCLLLCAHSVSALAAERGRKESPPSAVIDPTLQLPTSRILAVAQGPKGSRRIYTATETGLLISMDGGWHWTSLPLPADQIGEILALAASPVDEDLLYIGSRTGIWRSKNGETLSPLPGTLPSHAVPRAIAVGGEGDKTIYVATDQHGIFRSADAGGSWVSANSGLPLALAGDRPELVRTLVADPKVPLIAYAATELHGVYKTTDGGASWLPVNRGMGPFPLPHYVSGPYLLMDSFDPKRLLALVVRPVHSHLAQTQLFQSSDSGERWFSLEAEFPPDTQGVGLVEDPVYPKSVLVFTTAGTLRAFWMEIGGVAASEQKP